MESLTTTQIEQFKQDYRIKTGFELDVIKGSDEKAKAFINRVYMIVLQKVRSYQPEFDINDSETTEHQKAIIWAAMLEQAEYMIVVGDFYLMSGYDPVTGQLTPKAELEKRAFSDLARTILGNAGLLYRGIRKRSASSYLEERSYWGRM